jgi:hypothetical protein
MKMRIPSPKPSPKNKNPRNLVKIGDYGAPWGSIENAVSRQKLEIREGLHQ